MTDQQDWATPGSGGLPPTWSPDQPPPFRPVPQPGPGMPSSFGHGGVPPTFGTPPAPKPGIVPLRPLGVGELIDGSFACIRRNPKATLGLAALVSAVAGVLHTVVLLAFSPDLVSTVENASATTPAPAVLVALVAKGTALALVGGVVQLVATLILTGMLTAVVGEAVLGRTATVAQAWRAARPRLPALLGVSLAVPAVVCLLFLVAVALPVAGLLLVHAPVPITVFVGGVLAVAVIGVTVWLGVSWAVAAPAVVLEGVGPIHALRRSYALVKGGFWRVLGILLLAALLVFLVGGLLSLPFAIGQEIPVLTHPDPHGLTFTLSVVIGQLGSIVSGTVTSPFSAGVAVLLYVDLRMRREGLDLALRAAASTPPGPGAAAADLWRVGPAAPPYGGYPVPPGYGPPPPPHGDGPHGPYGSAGHGPPGPPPPPSW